MSGGHFDYNQFQILRIEESVQEEIDKMGKPKPKSELYCDPEFYEKYPEDRFYHTYTDDVVDQLKRGVMYLRMAYIYAQRIDWMLSGDDSKETFLERLKEDINELPYRI